MSLQHMTIRLNDQDALIELYADSEKKTLRVRTIKGQQWTEVTVDGPSFLVLRAAIQHATGEAS